MPKLTIFRQKAFIALLIIAILVVPASSTYNEANAEPVTIGTALTLAATAGAISAAFSAIVYLTDCVTDDTDFDFTEFCAQTAAGFAVGFGAAFAMIIAAALAAGGTFAAGVGTVLGVAAGSISSDPIVSQAISDKIAPWVRPIVEEVFDGESLFDGVGFVLGIPKFSLIKSLVVTVADRLMASTEMQAFQSDLEACGTPGDALIPINPQGISIIPGAIRNMGLIPAQSPFTVNIQCTDFAGGTLSSVSAAGIIMKKDGGLDMTLWVRAFPLATPGTYAVECSPLASLMDGEYSLYLSLEGTATTGQIKQGVLMTVYVGQKPTAPMAAINLLLCADGNCSIVYPSNQDDYVVKINGVKYFPSVTSADEDKGTRAWNMDQCLANPLAYSESYQGFVGGPYMWGANICEGRGKRLPTVEELLVLSECWLENTGWDKPIAPFRYLAQGNKFVRLDDSSIGSISTYCSGFGAYCLCVE